MRVEETEQILEAIAHDDVDALVIKTRRTGNAEVLTIGGAHVPYAYFFDSMQEGALTVDESGVILHVNRLISRLAGRADLVGSSVFSLLGDADLVRTLLQNVGEDRTYLESVLQTASGAHVPVRVCANVLPMSGPRRIGLLVTIHEIGNSRPEANLLSVARPAHPYEDVLEHLPTGTIVVDARTGNITYANHRAEEILGRVLIGQDRPVSYVELTCWRRDGTIIEPEQLPFARVLRGEVVSRMELVRSRANGGFVQTRSTAVPILNEEGRIESVLLAIEDATEEYKAQVEREKAERVLELFVAMLGHDLRQPLSSIVTLAALLKRRATLDENDARVVHRIESAAGRMVRMIQQIMDFARSRSHGIPVSPRPASLEEIVRTVVQSFEASQPGRSVTLSFEGSTTGEWDPDRLEQVVSNLVSNALTYGDPSQPVRVEVQGETKHTRMTVQNQGEPIQPTMLPFVFDPFTRGAGHARKAEGLGLGLYIAQQIVHAHDGTITVQSSEAGTTFTVILPRALKDAARQTPPAQCAKNAAESVRPSDLSSAHLK